MRHPASYTAFHLGEPEIDLADLVIGPSRANPCATRASPNRLNSSPIRFSPSVREPMLHMKFHQEQQRALNEDAPMLQVLRVNSRPCEEQHFCAQPGLQVVWSPLRYSCQKFGEMEADYLKSALNGISPPSLRPPESLAEAKASSSFQHVPLRNSLVAEAPSADALEDTELINTPTQESQPAEILLYAAPARHRSPQGLTPIQQNACRTELPSTGVSPLEKLQRPRVVRISSDDDDSYFLATRLTDASRPAQPLSDNQEIQWFQYNFSKAEDLCREIERAPQVSKKRLKNRLASINVRVRNRIVENKFTSQRRTKERKMKILSDTLREVLTDGQLKSITEETRRSWAKIDAKFENKDGVAVKKEGLVVKGRLCHRLSEKMQTRKLISECAAAEGRKSDLERIFENSNQVLEYGQTS